MGMNNEPVATGRDAPRVTASELAQVPALGCAGSPPVRLRAYVLAYLAVAVPICFLLLGRTDVVSMEGIIALGGHHMLQSGDWLVPRLYGEMYAFKPALAYWLAAGTEALFGRQTEFTLRLPTALCGFGLGLALFIAMGRLIGPRCGLYCALAAITSGLFLEQVDMAGFELPLALGLTVSMLAACRNLARDESDWRIWILGYAGLLLAFLSKGLPPVVFFAPGLIVGAMAAKRLPRLAGSGHLAGVMLFLAGAGLYAWLAYRAEGIDAFHQHFGEIALRSGQWTPGRVLKSVLKPVVIFGVMLPWSVTLVGWASRRLRPVLSNEEARISRVAWAFLIMGTLTFLSVPTGNTRYYLPLVTPVALLGGLGVERLPGRRAPQAAWALTMTGLIVWVVQVGFIQPHRAEKRSLRGVAQAFDPRVPPKTVVYVDTQDDYSSLFYYLGRPVKSWRSAEDQPPSGSYVVVVDRRAPPLNLRSNLSLEPVADQLAPDGHRYTLSRLVPASR
jgi:4-amino-4-deoxy-L-arabinose transferase-like glycosyltransferase